MNFNDFLFLRACLLPTDKIVDVPWGHKESFTDISIAIQKGSISSRYHLPSASCSSGLLPLLLH
jgi:hypothetical protein